MVAWARDEILKLLHPFMPFITEELWEVTATTKRGPLLTLTQWPEHVGLNDDKAEAEIGWVVDLVTAVRSLRSEMNIPPATLIPLALVNASTETQTRAQRWTDIVKRLARLAEISLAPAMPQGAVQLLVRGDVAALPLKGVVDLTAEKTRLDKEIAKADADIKRVDAKLGNANFVANAPDEVVEEQRERRAEAEARRAKHLEALERLKSAE
jgi:valyl-tRNA synthetase